MAIGGSQDPVSVFDSLLSRLAAGGDAAAEYERLRLRLVTFFRLRFPADADALADEAIDRLARRLGEGTPVESLAAYALGIARFLVMETAARRRKEDEAARAASYDVALHVEDEEPDAAIAALKNCLESIGPRSSQLILAYYVAEGDGSRIERRQQLAQAAGLSLNALRNRALRIRTALEACMSAALRALNSSPDRDGSAKNNTRSMMDVDPTEDAHE